MKLPAANIRKIAIFRALQLGDMLCTVPAFRALRATFPEAQITLLGLPWAKSFVDRFAMYLNGFIHFPGYPGLPEQPFDPQQWEIFRQKIQDQNFDLVLQMQGNGNIVNEMLREISNGTLAGFHSSGNYMKSETFIEYPNGISEIEKHLLMLENLGIPSKGTDLEFPVSSLEIENLKSLGLPVSDKTYVCVHPGSRGSWRQWPPSHFACLADLCFGMGYKIIVTGTKDEAEITEKVISLMDCPAIDLTGKTGLGEIGELIKNAAMLISNCTGVSHIASATKTPSIVISMDGEPERWGPLNTQIHKTIDWTKGPGFNFVKKQMEILLPSLKDEGLASVSHLNNSLHF